jgi:hypothetical protein
VRKPVTLALVGCVAAVAMAASVDALLPRGSSSPLTADSAQTSEKEGSDTAPVTTVRPDPIEPGGDACTTPTLCWSRKVALEAGFRIAGSSGSAWIVKGRNRSFYFWATRSANDLRAEGYRVVRRLAGVEILTDGVRLVWRLRRATIWIEAGPTEDSIASKPGELAELIAASRTLASG